MFGFVVRKILHTLFVALGVVTLVFAALRLSGDPAATMLPGDASVDELRDLRRALGLDQPLWAQYVGFLRGAVTGDFGTSFRHQQPALPLVLERLPATLELAGAALVLAVAVALPLGVLAAIYRGRALDVLAMGFAVIGQATPYFWMGIMLILIVSVELGWLPTSGRGGLERLRMAQMGGQIYPARYASDEGAKELARKPIGTGAYRVVEWVKDDRLVMDANREWWGWNGKGPGVDRVVWKPIPDDFARLSALQRGEVDVITNVPPDQMKIVKTMTVPATRTVVFQMNATRPPLADKRVRQALHHATDIPSIVKNLYAGQGKPFSGGLADTDFGYNAAIKPYPYDPERAKKLLAEAGYPNGIDVTLYAGSGTMVNDKQLLEALADMWSKAGIRAKVEMMEMAQRQKMLNERTTPPNSLLLGNPQSTLLDADGSLWRILHPTGFAGKNWVGSQPGHRFHDLMEQARYTLDQKKRKELYTEATRIIHDEKPGLELFQEVVICGVSPRVSFRPRADYRLIVSEMTVGR